MAEAAGTAVADEAGKQGTPAEGATGDAPATPPAKPAVKMVSIPQDKFNKTIADKYTEAYAKAEADQAAKRAAQLQEMGFESEEALAEHIRKTRAPKDETKIDIEAERRAAASAAVKAANLDAAKREAALAKERDEARQLAEDMGIKSLVVSIAASQGAYDAEGAYHDLMRQRRFRLNAATRTVEVVTTDGLEEYGTGGKLMPPEEAVAEYFAARQWLLKPDARAGAGQKPGASGGGTNASTITRSALGDLAKTDRARYDETMKRVNAGQCRVVDNSR